MDQTLEERIAASRANNRSGRRNRSRPDRRYNSSRGENRNNDGRAPSSNHGVTKNSSRHNYEPTSATQEWLHDRFEDEDDDMYDNGDSYGNKSDRNASNRSRREGPADVGDGPVRTSSGKRGYRVRISNLHEDLTNKDLADVFGAIGGLLEASIIWDRDRSSGRANVIYASRNQALSAARKFDRQLAMGQTIHVEYDYRAEEIAPAPGRQAAKGRLEDRISFPEEERTIPATRPGIDRYVPAGRRSPTDRRSPPPRRNTPIHAAGRRERGRGRGRGDNAPRRGGSVRPRKTKEDLDAEMEDYFGPNETQAATETSAPASVPAPAEGDMELDLEL